MSQTITFNGLTFTIPDDGDETWGDEVTAYFAAIPQGALQKTGGLFTLTADVNFGATYGVTSKYFKTRTANIATAGQIRLARADVISFRNAANSGNLDLGVSAGDLLTFNGTAIQPVGAYITALTGEVTATGPGSVVATVANSAVLSKVLTGFVSTPGTISATDTILQAFQKAAGNVATPSITAFGSTPNAAGGSFSGNALTLQPASYLYPGGITIGAQAFQGTKSFDIVICSDLATQTIVATEVSATSLVLSNPTAGTVTLQMPASGSFYNFNLPVNAGVSGQVLTSQGGSNSAMTWSTPVSGTVTSVALSVAASIFSVTGSPVTASGTLALVQTGTSGGVPYFSSTSALSSSALLVASQLILGGGAGSAPSTLAAGSQYQSLVMGAAVPGYGAVNLAQAAAVTGILPNGNTTAASANTASAIVARDGSGNFTAGAITAVGTLTASSPSYPNVSITSTSTNIAAIRFANTNSARVWYFGETGGEYQSAGGFLIGRDGFAGTMFMDADGKVGINNQTPGTDFDVTGTIRASTQLINTVATGTAPLAITSTTLVPNLYVARAVLADSPTTNANLTGPITSVGNATSIASQTGTGTKFVVDTSPTLVTPNIGTPTAGVLSSCTGLPLTTGVTGTLPIANGGTAVTSVTTSPTASSFAGWDANSNMSAFNFIEGYATTATAAATTTLVVGSKRLQYFTGSTTQIVALPVTSTLVLGQSFKIVNNSSGAVTVNSSGGNAVQVMGASSVLTVTCILTSGTTAASWASEYGTASAATVTSVAVTVPSGLTVSGSPVTTSGTIAITASGQFAASQMPAFTGDITTSAGAVATTAAATQANIVTLSRVGGVAVRGTNTNDAAAAGYVGEYVESTVSAQNFPANNTWGDITSISLTAGDWDISAIALGTINGATVTTWDMGIGTASGTATTGLSYGVNEGEMIGFTGVSDNTITIPSYRVSISGTTTFYMKTHISYSVATPKVYARLSARRVR